MANITETSPVTYPAGVYQIENGDPATGGLTGIFVLPSAALANRTAYLKAHVDAIEAERAPLASPALTGVPTAPNPGDAEHRSQLATIDYVQSQDSGALGVTSPLMAGVAAVGAATKCARDDHRHPTDTSRAPLASPDFTGIPLSVTPADATTAPRQIATVGFVAELITSASVAAASETVSGRVELATAAETATGTDNSLAIHPQGLKSLLPSISVPPGTIILYWGTSAPA